LEIECAFGSYQLFLSHKNKLIFDAVILEKRRGFFSNPDETATFAWFFKSTRYETIITMDLDRFSECVFDGAEAIAQVDGES
jgi:hypothetical protein